MLKIRSFKTKKLSQKLIKNILILKNETWKYGVTSQFNHFVKNYKDKDYHNLMFKNEELIGYTSFRKRQIKCKKRHFFYLLLDTITIKKKFRKKGYSNNLMKFNNKFVKNIGLKSFLFCKSKNVKFFRKYGWSIANKEHFFLVNHKFAGRYMCFNFKYSNNFKYFVYV